MYPERKHEGSMLKGRYPMDYPVILNNQPVGSCRLEEQGLYWTLECRCQVISDLVERLYCGTTRLGVLEREGEWLTLRRRLSRASYPMLPPRSGVLTLRPVEEAEPWEGWVLDQYLHSVCRGDTLLFPYDPNGPCPCEPLLCFFTIQDGFWQLPVDPVKTLNLLAE